MAALHAASPGMGESELRFHSFDLPGHGRNGEVQPDPSQWLQWAADAVGTEIAAPSENSLTVGIGHSMGASALLYHQAQAILLPRHASFDSASTGRGPSGRESPKLTLLDAIVCFEPIVGSRKSVAEAVESDEFAAMGQGRLNPPNVMSRATLKRQQLFVETAGHSLRDQLESLPVLRGWHPDAVDAFAAYPSIFIKGGEGDSAPTFRYSCDRSWESKLYRAATPLWNLLPTVGTSTCSLAFVGGCDSRQYRMLFDDPAEQHVEGALRAIATQSQSSVHKERAAPSVRVLDRCSHMLPMQKPEQCAAIALGHLSQLWKDRQ